MRATRQFCNSLIATVIISVGPAVHSHAAITIDFDLSTDSTNNFFGNTTTLATLNAAGDFFESLFLDNLSDITPSGGNSWTASFFHPETGAVDTSQTNLTIAANTVKIFVGARDLGSTTLGQAGPGGFGASGTSSWLDTVRARGQGNVEGATADDFGPWGGSLAIDINSTWNLDHTTTPSSGQNDLYSVILHELGHVFGIGTADSWDAMITGSDFTGAASVAAFGGDVPLQPGGAHWAEGTTSTVFGTSTSQEAAMDPTITVGSRKLFTTLDVAGLNDIGWETVPEPSTIVLSLLGLTFFGAYAGFRRRQKAAALAV